MKILLVEDEQLLADALEHILMKHGYLVDCAYDGTEGYLFAETGIYDIIILDRMLPGMDGVTIMQRLRAKNIQTPIIMLTARGSVDDRVSGLDAGANDYLIKPFATKELLARIRAQTRVNAKNDPSQLACGDLFLDTKSCEATLKNISVKLTLKETQLLEYLMRNKGQVLAKETILNRVWGFDSESDTANLDVYIFFLRKKINFGQCGLKLETVRGVGFKLKEVAHV
ncbi:MAG: response regulator transcription factor [Negativicutes bacterium]|jgi:DNA-binding response OmpR family regulator